MASKFSMIEPILPFDILISIINQVAHEGDTKTLRACSSLRHDLLPHCRKHLFSTFDMRKIRVSEEEILLIKFYYFISINPHLIPYVRNVHILDFAYRPESVCDHPFLPRLLGLLTGVGTFGLHFVRVVSWDRLAPALVSVMTEMVARPGFVELYLAGILDFHPSFLNGCRFLKTLTIVSSSLHVMADTIKDEEQELIHVAEEDLIRLEVTSFSNLQPFLSNLEVSLDRSQLLVDFSLLKELNINFTPAIFSATLKFIHRARRTLETLKISQLYEDANVHAFMISSVAGEPPQLLPHITLAALTELRHFACTILLQDLSHSLPRDLVEEWSLLLRTSPGGMQTISITLDLFYSNMQAITKLFSQRRPRARKSSKSAREDGRDFLTPLDEALSNAEYLPSLAEVRLEVQLPEDLDDSSDSEYAGYQSGTSSMTFEEIETSVTRMMKLTRKRLSRMATGWFSIDVRIGS